MTSDRGAADRVAAWAAAVGVGLIALMLSWLIGNRVTGMIWEAPLGPAVALLTAIAVGFLTAILVGRRLTRRIN